MTRKEEEGDIPTLVRKVNQKPYDLPGNSRNSWFLWNYGMVHQPKQPKGRTKQGKVPTRVGSLKDISWRIWKWKWSRVQLFVTPWTTARQAALSMEFSRQEYWSGLSFPSPGDLPNPGIKSGPPALWADSLPSEPQGKLLGGHIIQEARGGKWHGHTASYLQSKEGPALPNLAELGDQKFVPTVEAMLRDNFRSWLEVSKEELDAMD